MRIELFTSIWFYPHKDLIVDAGYSEDEIIIHSLDDNWHLSAFGTETFLVNTRDMHLNQEDHAIEQEIIKWINNNPRSKFSTNVAIEVEVEGLGLF